MKTFKKLLFLVFLLFIACKKETTIEQVYIDPIFRNCKTLNDSIKGTYMNPRDSYNMILKFDSIGNVVHLNTDCSILMGDSIAKYTTKGNSKNFTLTIKWVNGRTDTCTRCYFENYDIIGRGSYAFDKDNYFVFVRL